MKGDQALIEQLREWFAPDEAKRIKAEAVERVVRRMKDSGGVTTSEECLQMFEAELRKLMRQQ